MSGLKIVFLLRFFPIYGGGESVTRLLAEKLEKKGHRVVVGYLWDKGHNNDINYRTRKIANTKGPIGKDAINRKEYNKIESGLVDLLSNEKPDIIINQWLPSKIVYNANKSNAKIITCKHSAMYIHSWKWNIIYKLFRNSKKYILKWYYRDIYNYTDKLVLLCEQFEKEAKDIFGDDEDKISYIYNPCRYIDKVNCIKKEKKILCVGRIYKEKRVDMLINIWKELEDKISDWSLVVIGDGPDYEKCIDLSNSLNIKNISFTGYIDPTDYYKRSKIIVSTSETEGFPMTLIEGMHYGVVPVVMDTYSSVREVVPKDCGLVTEDDEASFRNDLLSLMIDDNRLNQMSSNARNSTERFEINKIIDLWENLFSDLEGQN